MTATYDPALCERLCREAREDDERMTAAPWTCDDPSGRLYGDSQSTDGPVELAWIQDEALCWDGGAIARQRNNLRAMADQLQAAGREAERLRGLVDDWSTSSILNGTERDRLRHDLNIARADAATARKSWDERDKLRAEVERIRNQRDVCESDLIAVANQRDQLRSDIADRDGRLDQLIAQREEAERRRDAALRRVKELEAEVSRLNDDVLIDVAEERDIARAERDKLRAEVEAMRPVVESAEQWRDHVYRGRTATSDGVRICDAPIIAAVDAYRAARDKAGDAVSRPDGCKCHWEQGDSPCPVHGEDQ